MTSIPGYTHCVLVNLANRNPSFWFIQLGGWSVYGVAVVVTSVPLLHQRDYIAFRAAYVLSAFLGSFIVYAVCHCAWKRSFSPLASLAWCASTSLILGFLCSAVAVWAETRFGGVERPFSWAAALSGTSGNSFLFLAWAAMYFGVKHYQALEQKQLQLAQSKALAHDAQLRALRYQLQPHFLFNTLNAISTLVLDNRNQDARRMIASLADLLRNTIEAPDTHLVPLSEEVLLVDQYLAIEQVRFGERLRVKLDHGLQALDVNVPRLILLPLVENAVRHGIACRPEGGEILISSRVDHKMLTLRVLNDCADSVTPVTKTIEGSGVGIANTRSRLETLYGENQGLEIAQAHCGKFEVILFIPIVHGFNAHDRGEAATI